MSAARAACWLARRWLGLWLAGATLLLALPFAAPLLAASGHERAAGLLYAAHRPLCHQLPHHSWFVGGPAPAYAAADVAPVMPPDVARMPPSAWLHRPVIDTRLGYQLAVCQRDLATYAGLLLASLAYAAGARAGRRTGLGARGLGARAYALALVPIALDGGTQLAGWRESTPLLRTATGALFGAATALFVLPQLAALAEGEPRRPDPASASRTPR